MNPSRWVVGFVTTVVASAALFAPTPASASTPAPPDDPFYTYTGDTPLADIAPGTVLKTREGSVTFQAFPNPIPWVQLLYRTRTQLGDPTVTATTILRSPVPSPITRVVSYQSFYDSLTTRCEPSYMLNGGPDNSLWTSEKNFYESLLAQGYTVVTSDFEGQDPTFATGPVYGYQTLDGIRAAYNSNTVGFPANAPLAMAGYSGGAIATEWASELAPTYAPDVNSKLVGSAFGGVFVHPLHNLHYVDGAVGSWSSVMPLALIGIAKAFKIDLTPYLSAKGAEIVNMIKNDCIGEHTYPSLTFASLVKPQYAIPESLPFLVNTANELIMGTGGTPTIPMFIRQGTDGPSEGTQPSPTYGPGDGVMLVNDVRSLAHKYCDAGRPIDYAEAPLGHGNQGAAFLAEMVPWMQAQFAGSPGTNTCVLIQQGNSLAPTPPPTATTCMGKPATIFGTAGDDVLEGTEGDDVIAGLGGNDTIHGAGGDDVICGDSGNDQLFGDAGNDGLRGGSGDDRLYGGAGSDSVGGEAGNDLLAGGSDADHLAGGAGFDRVNYADHAAAVHASIGNGTADDGNSSDGPRGARDTISSSVEELLGGPGGDTLIGNSAANVLYGRGGNDRLYGSGGSDKLSGGDGDDALHGGYATDILVGGPGVDALYGDADSDRLYAKDGTRDARIDGGGGSDRASVDPIDPTPVHVP